MHGRAFAMIAMTVAVAGAAAPGADELPTEPEFLLKIVDSDIVADLNALCLSGTPPGYYFRPGSAANASKFKIHFEGGGCEWG
jgi:hypothetical protein